jgi:putative PIN family toxin of toxin-antitoxin system
MRVVVDTNILISATGWEGNERELIHHALNGEISILISDEILSEYLEVIHRDKFSFLDRKKIKRFILLLLEFCEVIEVKTKVNVITSDPDDNMVLACAKEGNADIIVSGNAHLLDLMKWSGIRIITCSELLKEI